MDVLPFICKLDILVDGHLSGFRILVLVKAAMNVLTQVFAIVYICVFILIFLKLEV